MRNSQWIVFVTAGRWQVPGIIAAKNLGLKVLAIDQDKGAEGFLFAHKSIVSELDRYEEILTQIEDLGLSILGAVSFVSDAGMWLTGLIRERFNLPGPRGLVIEALIDKGVQREAWAREGLQSPDFEVCSSQDHVARAVSRLGLPVIVKPVDSSGSRGITRINSSNFDARFAFDVAVAHSRSRRVIVEEFIVGTEFTVESFFDNGRHYPLAVFEKSKVPGTGDTVSAELFTPDRSHSDLVRLIKLVGQAYLSLGYRTGPGHAEALLDRQGNFYLVEVAGRAGGFLVGESLVPEVSGVDLSKLTILSATGFDIPSISINSGKYARLRFIPSKEGKVKAIRGIQPPVWPGKARAGSLVKIGDHLRNPLSDADRVAWILSTGASFSEALDSAEQAEREIFIDIN